MTQAATPEAVKRSDFDNVTLTKRETLVTGQRPDGTPIRQELELPYRLQRRGDEFWASFRGIDDRLGPMDMERQIVMTTGSHHYQMYWTAADKQSPLAANRQVKIFPFVYLYEADRWIPREAALITPPHLHQSEDLHWSENCIRCHSTHGQPRLDTVSRTADTRVAELGIACEACHGPAEEHVRANQNPARRYELHLAGGDDATIINPLKLTAERSSQLCGQCHAIASFAQRDWDEGYWNRYHVGEDLERTRNIVRVEQPDSLAEVRAAYDRKWGERRMPDGRLVADVDFGTFQDGRYWSDGVVRVGGREYNAITGSACYDGGKLSCLSCHSMHDSDPTDQLAHDRVDNRACVQCHNEYEQPAAVEAHTHHPAASSGSQCYNCHMPFTSYGLLKATRSHTIDSPRVRTALESGRPTACNQCHLDQTLDWTQRHLKEWYPATEDLELSDDQRDVSASVLWAVQGDAGQRALAAWTMGWEDARQASGQNWFVPYLANLLNDPYPAVRFIAARSLRLVEGFADFEYDFLGDEDSRRAAKRKALDVWEQAPGSPDRRGSAILLDETGRLDQTTFDRLLKQRNDKDLDLNE
jgi:predicted CXXCH cytochrome family protein